MFVSCGTHFNFLLLKCDLPLSIFSSSLLFTDLLYSSSFFLEENEALNVQNPMKCQHIKVNDNSWTSKTLFDVLFILPVVFVLQYVGFGSYGVKVETRSHYVVQGDLELPRSSCLSLHSVLPHLGFLLWMWSCTFLLIYILTDLSA